MKRKKEKALRSKSIGIIFFAVFTVQMLLPGCVLNPEESNDRLYEFWTIDGRSIDYYRNNLPEDMDYPTHLLLENYVPGQKLRGQIKMIRQGWLPSDSAHAAIGGIGFTFNKRYGPYGLISRIVLHIFVISDESIEGYFVFVDYGMDWPFAALNNFCADEILEHNQEH